MNRLLLAMAFSLALVGCQSQPQSYDNPRQIVAAMADADIDCEELETAARSSRSADEHESLVAELGVCRVEGEKVMIATFEHMENRDDWVSVAELLGPVAVGPDWAVAGRSEQIVSDIAEALNVSGPGGREGGSYPPAR